MDSLKNKKKLTIVTWYFIFSGRVELWKKLCTCKIRKPIWNKWNKPKHTMPTTVSIFLYIHPKLEIQVGRQHVSNRKHTSSWVVLSLYLQSETSLFWSTCAPFCTGKHWPVATGQCHLLCHNILLCLSIVLALWMLAFKVTDNNYILLQHIISQATKQTKPINPLAYYYH